MSNLITATQQVKSNIQLELDKIERAKNLQNFINNVLENYDCDDIVFGITEAGPSEITTGYMAIKDRFDTLEEAIRTVDQPNSLIRYTCNGFFTGTYHRCMSECANDVKFDIGNLEYIY